MKYTKDQFERALKCFDETAAVAHFNGSSSFICIPLYDDPVKACEEPCKPYCPAYGSGLVRECYTYHDAAYWRFAKEKFIIENEPKDSEDIK